MKASFLKSVLYSASLLTASLPLFAQNVVYDNTQTDRGQFYFSLNQYGDEINLAGTDRILSKFEFYYFFSGTTPGGSAVLRIWDNTGSSPAGSPGTLLYTGDPFTLSPGNNTETIDFSTATTTITLPSTFTWTIQFSSLGANQAGLLVYGPPNTGSSFSDFWENSGGTWSTMGITGVPSADFAARVTAVPEPGTLAIGALVLLIGAARYRAVRRD